MNWTCREGNNEKGVKDKYIKPTLIKPASIQKKERKSAHASMTRRQNHGSDGSRRTRFRMPRYRLLHLLLLKYPLFVTKYYE